MSWWEHSLATIELHKAWENSSEYLTGNWFYFLIWYVENMEQVFLANHIETWSKTIKSNMVTVNTYTKSNKNCSNCKILTSFSIWLLTLFLTLSLPWVTKTEFLLTISVPYKWWELRQKKIMGLLIDPIPNSPNWHNENHLADCKENC